MSITTYKIDAKNCFMFALQRDSKGDREVLVEPPEAPAGHVARWVTDLHSTTDAVTFGEPGTGTWEVVEDHRTDKLYLTADGSTYTIDADVDGQTYTGVDVLPAWLTATARPGKNYSWTAGAWVLDVAAQLADDQADQTALMYQAYETAVTQSVSFESADGVTQTFQADANSQNILVQSYTGFAAAGAVPAGFYWVAADNTQVPFILADLKGLYAAMLAQGWTAFQNLQVKKAAIRAATTSAEALSITW